MRSAILLTLTFAGWLSAAPPVVTLPAEVPGEVAAFVLVKADVKEAKAVKFLPLDSGLSVFPSGLLNDPTVTVVVASKPGRYRVLAYAGNADGASEPATTTVVIGGAKPPPVDPNPTPTDPPPTTPGKMFFVIVRPVGPINPATEKLLTLPAWADIKKDGHAMRDFPADQLPPGIVVPPGTTLPTLLPFRYLPDGKSIKSAGNPQPLPTSDDQIRGLLK